MDDFGMPRKPRFFLPGLPAHVIQRGNNRQPVFFDKSDFLFYLSLLGEASNRYGAAIHTYVLMNNHVHLLMTPAEKTSVSSIMQFVGRCYVPFINNKYRRSGTLWDGRFKASIVDSAGYVLACYRYIELNPVRAGMVSKPWEYPWSGYHCNALEAEDRLVTPNAEYLALNDTPAKRAANYRQLFSQTLGCVLLSDIRQHLQSGTPLGNDRFRCAVEAQLARKIGHVRRGRPKTRV
jgi:putative transposase